MPSMFVTYTKRTLDEEQNEVFLALGTETVEGVSEVLLPQYQQERKIYFIKKFAGEENYQWLVHSVERSPPSDTTCATFKVVLETPADLGPVEYLHQTLKKGKGRTIQSVVRPGSLVEVDYGHELAVGRSDGELRSNKRYSDTIQKGEMHKRRLAVVVTVSRSSTLQVVPITSQEPASTDKTAFEVSTGTLGQLKFYGNSGKQSWAIANMIETVSTRRVLPPLSYYNSRGHRTSGRDTNYSISLSTAENRLLKEALLHSIAVRDYYINLSSLSQAKAQILLLQPLIAQVNDLDAQSQIMKKEIEHLRLCKEVADMWAKNMNYDLMTEVNELKSLYAEDSDPGTAAV